MGCGCKNNTIDKDNLRVIQLYSKDKKAFPLSIVQAITDPCTNKSLDELLKQSNHIFLNYNTNFETTVSSSPIKRKGLYITYVDAKGNVVSKKYVGRTLSDIDWTNPLNWVADSASIPEELLEKIHALEEKEVGIDPALENRVKALEDKADDCNCDLSPLEARIATLEGKEDKDTIFNPDALNEAVNSLKSEVAKLKEDLQKEKEKKDKYVVSGRWVDKEDGTSAIILTMSDDTEVEIPIPLYEKPEEEPKPKKLIKFGYHETERIGDYASVNDLSGSIEVDTLPKEITFGEDKRDVYGYWIVAINKELAPNTTSGNIYMYANGDYLPMVSGYEVEEATIEGVEYIIIKDIDIEEISQVSLRFT